MGKLIRLLKCLNGDPQKYRDFHRVEKSSPPILQVVEGQLEADRRPSLVAELPALLVALGGVSKEAKNVDAKNIRIFRYIKSLAGTIIFACILRVSMLRSSTVTPIHHQAARGAYGHPIKRRCTLSFEILNFWQLDSSLKRTYTIIGAGNPDELFARLPR